MTEIFFTNAGDIQRRLAAVPIAVKRMVTRRVAQDIIRLNKERTKRQVNVDGTAFQKHRHLRPRKMLTRLSNRLRVSDIQEGILIGFNNRIESAIGARQQFGISQPGNVVGTNQRPVNADAPASRSLAKELLKEGYKRKEAGKAAKKPSIKWIMDNIKTGRGWLILRLLRIQNGTDTTLIRGMPQRSILGVSDSDVAFLTAIALHEAEAALAQTTGT